MKKLIAAVLLFTAIAPVSGMAQENMMFGQRNNVQTYQAVKTQGKAVVVVNNPQSCNPPSGLIGKSIDQINGMRFSQPVRIIHPGDMLTSEYSEKRLNIDLDQRGIIRGLHCG